MDPLFLYNGATASQGLLHEKNKILDEKNKILAAEKTKLQAENNELQKRLNSGRHQLCGKLPWDYRFALQSVDLGKPKEPSIYVLDLEFAHQHDRPGQQLKAAFATSQQRKTVGRLDVAHAAVRAINAGADNQRQNAGADNQRWEIRHTRNGETSEPKMPVKYYASHMCTHMEAAALVSGLSCMETHLQLTHCLASPPMWVHDTSKAGGDGFLLLAYTSLPEFRDTSNTYKLPDREQQISKSTRLNRTQRAMHNLEILRLLRDYVKLQSELTNGTTGARLERWALQKIAQSRMHTFQHHFGLILPRHFAYSATASGGRNGRYVLHLPSFLEERAPQKLDRPQKLSLTLEDDRKTVKKEFSKTLQHVVFQILHPAYWFSETDALYFVNALTSHLLSDAPLDFDGFCTDLDTCLETLSTSDGVPRPVG